MPLEAAGMVASTAFFILGKAAARRLKYQPVNNRASLRSANSEAAAACASDATRDGGVAVEESFRGRGLWCWV